jgi:hypothetical protein
MRPVSSTPPTVSGVSPALDDLRPPSAYHGPCAVCGEFVIGQELVRIRTDALHAGCSPAWSDRQHERRE